MMKKRRALLIAASTQNHHSYYPDTPDISGVCDYSRETIGVCYGIIYGNDVISESDTVKVAAEITRSDLSFVDMTAGDEYQQTFVDIAQMIGVELQYAVAADCHGVYLAPDHSEAHLVNIDGTKHTEDAFILGIGTASDVGNVIFVLSNNNYPLSGNYEIYKKRFETQ